MRTGLDPALRRAFVQRMRVPLLAFAALLVLLAAIVLLGALVPSLAASWVELGLALCMAVTVLLFSMEVREETPILRLFSGLGFAWVAILFGMTLVDYLTR